MHYRNTLQQSDLVDVYFLPPIYFVSNCYCLTEVINLTLVLERSSNTLVILG